MGIGKGSKRCPGTGGGSSTKGKAGASMKFRPTVETRRTVATGTKPVAEVASVQHVLTMMVVHLSRKILYGAEIAHRVGIYVLGSLVLSIVADFSGASMNYFADKDNFFNVYFVKYGFGWTLLLLGPFVCATSHTTSCGTSPALKNSLVRLAIVAAIWLSAVRVFYKIEDVTGLCQNGKIRNMNVCKEGGFVWKGLDISGHCFLLVSCNLTIMEEAKSYLGWERIKDVIRNEQHKRLATNVTNAEANEDSTFLSKLTTGEFLHLKANYSNYTAAVRVLFCLASVLVLMWDFMLFCTVMYFHKMIEKVVASCLAVVVWFSLYRVIFAQPWSPGLPGENGPFKYVVCGSKIQRQHPTRKDGACRRDPDGSNKDEGFQKFMGMPLYAPNQKPKIFSQEEAEKGNSLDRRSIAEPGKFTSRSRSSSRVRGSSKSLINAKYF